MICSAYFGVLSDKRKTNWNNGGTNPYEVLGSSISLGRIGHELLGTGAEYFREEIKIDWGSYAWKCTPDAMIRFLNDHKAAHSWLNESEEEMLEKVKVYIEESNDEEFGVVFIEEC